MTCCWMMGVFFFSILVGNIRDILGTAMVHRNEYRRRLVAISNYMQKFKVPSMVQDRVKLWLQYTWEHQKIFNESEVLAFLPPKMRTDLALKVHYATLSKVKLFQDCDTGADIVRVLCRNTHPCGAGRAAEGAGDEAEANGLPAG